MVPKIADFGLSRLLGPQKSRTIISGNFAGSLYAPFTKAIFLTLSTNKLSCTIWYLCSNLTFKLFYSGYMAPEYLLQGVVSPKADIFSLGVIIIEIITGHRNYPQSTAAFLQNFDNNDSRPSNEISLKKFIDMVRRIYYSCFATYHFWLTYSIIFRWLGNGGIYFNQNRSVHPRKYIRNK